MANEQVVYIDIDLEDLIPEFMENRKNDVIAVKELLAQGNLNEIKRIGHSMKGSGGGYGFDRITEIGKMMEDAANEGDVAVIVEANENLNEYLSAVKIVWQEE